jgi:hypothetical protein
MTGKQQKAISPKKDGNELLRGYFHLNNKKSIKIKIAFMKKIVLIISILFYSAFTYAQNGLENVIVEIYYVSDANDTNANSVGGVLPVGSVTYRVYADMLPGYDFQAAYGVNTPGASHDLRIETSTLFFNNEDRGAPFPTYTKAQSQNNTVMLDSWLSVGAGCAGHLGIMKAGDDGVNNNVNTFSPQVLQNNDTSAGIPLTTQDGLIAGVPNSVTEVGISTAIAMFDNQNDGTNGPVFFTDNGSWASLLGSMGPDSLDNKVLIAQITTDGVFSFELNIQIGTPTGGAENYVAKNPVGTEIQMGSLTYPPPAGIGEPHASIPLFVAWPNPVSEDLTIKIIADKQSTSNEYTIYDINGRAIFHKNLGAVTNTFLEHVDMSSFTPGEYIVQLISNGSMSSKKIIKN